MTVRVIGIDPGVKTGFAAVAGDVVVELRTFDFWEAFDSVLYHYGPAHKLDLRLRQLSRISE